MNLKDIKTIDVNGREWFDRVNGNSYFTATVVINYAMEDEKVIEIPFTYGYGDQYLYESLKTIEANISCPTRWCRERGIILRAHKCNVTRKRDL